MICQTCHSVLLDKKFPFSHFSFSALCFLHVCASIPHLFLCTPPRDHNENKILLVLYYAITATVSLDVELLDAFGFILRKLH